MPPRLKGGQPGNSNARTHGLWAKYQPMVTPEEQDPNAGPEQRRDIMDRVIKVLWEDFCEAEDPETRCKISNALCVAVTAANGCDRTLAIVTGKISPLQQAIEELLAEEDPDDYSTIEQINQKGDQGEYVEGTDGMGEEDGGEPETVPGGDRGGDREVGGEARGKDVRGDAAEAERKKRTADAPVRVADVPIREEGRKNRVGEPDVQAADDQRDGQGADEP